MLLCHKEGTYVTAEYNTTVQNDSESQCYESVVYSFEMRSFVILREGGFVENIFA